MIKSNCIYCMKEENFEFILCYFLARLEIRIGVLRFSPTSPTFVAFLLNDWEKLVSLS
jgi:hypothetical protein